MAHSLDPVYLDRIMNGDRGLTHMDGAIHEGDDASDEEYSPQCHDNIGFDGVAEHGDKIKCLFPRGYDET